MTARCAIALLVGMAGCGARSLGDLDGGPPVRALDPINSDALGLAFGERGVLRVRYSDGAGHRAGEPVSFAIVADAALGESAGGATLSAAQAVTDADGAAEVSVVAGAARAQFRIRATAAHASPVIFYVSVSDTGFAALELVARRSGDRPLADFGAVEARLYMGGTGCAALLAATAEGVAPESPFPPRSAAGFGLALGFAQVPAGEAYSLLAWGAGAGPGAAVLATGCVDLGTSQLRAGTTVQLELTLPDLPPLWAAEYAAQSTLLLAPLYGELRGEAWKLAPCPSGAAQAVLDCAVDALDAGDPLDCVVASPQAVAQAIQNRRGAADADGCRPATVTGQPSADALAQQALAGPVTAPARSLAGLATQLADLLDDVRLRSRLAPAGDTARHWLDAVAFELGGVEAVTELAESDRPLLVADAALGRDQARVTLAGHGFSLRLAPAARATFAARALGPAGISAAPDALGSALVGAAEADAMTGCAAISSAVCTGAGQSASCLTAACTASLPVLDAAYDAPFLRLAASSVDLTLAGSALPVDADLDRLVEALVMGQWQAQIGVAAGTRAVSGTWATMP